MMDKAVFVFSEEYLKYKFNPDHPFNQLRLKLTLDLLQKMNAIHEGDIVSPRMATDEELTLIHDPNYVNAVKKAGRGELPEAVADNYGLGTEDTPIFPRSRGPSSFILSRNGIPLNSLWRANTFGGFMSPRRLSGPAIHKPPILGIAFRCI